MTSFFVVDQPSLSDSPPRLFSRSESARARFPCFRFVCVGACTDSISLSLGGGERSGSDESKAPACPSTGAYAPFACRLRCQHEPRGARTDRAPANELTVSTRVLRLGLTWLVAVAGSTAGLLASEPPLGPLGARLDPAERIEGRVAVRETGSSDDSCEAN